MLTMEGTVLDCSAGGSSKLAHRASLGHTGTSSGEGSGGPCCCRLRDERLHVPDPDFLLRGIVPPVYRGVGGVGGDQSRRGSACKRVEKVVARVWRAEQVGLTVKARRWGLTLRSWVGTLSPGRDVTECLGTGVIEGVPVTWRRTRGRPASTGTLLCLDAHPSPQTLLMSTFIV